MQKRRLSANTLRSAHSTNALENTTNDSKQIEKLLKQMEDFKVEYEQENNPSQHNKPSQDNPTPRHNAISYNYNLNADIPLTLIQNELRGQRGQSDGTRENGLEVIRSLMFN